MIDASSVCDCRVKSTLACKSLCAVSYIWGLSFSLFDPYPINDVDKNLNQSTDCDQNTINVVLIIISFIICVHKKRSKNFVFVQGDQTTLLGLVFKHSAALLKNVQSKYIENYKWSNQPRYTILNNF